jgi:deoxyuridine 5'-triphosphate nucleotidohydrolase
MDYALVREVKEPIRGTSKSAGMDLFMPTINRELEDDISLKNPNYTQFYFLNGNLTIYPQGRILIPAGVHVRIPEGFCLQVLNKSGVSSKLGLCKLAELIDEDYQGEIHINLVNTSNKPVTIESGMKLVQLVMIAVNIESWEKTTLEDLYPQESERGTKGFGSTDGKE